MTDVFVTRACAADAREMADLLNEVTAAGSDRLNASDFLRWMDTAGPGGLGHVARSGDGKLLGFQWLDPCSVDGSDVAQIATFVREGQSGLAVGSRLFEATRKSATAQGYDWMEATIGADNDNGLTYYQSQGFETWHSDPDARRSDGRRTDKIRKRYKLT